MHDLDLKDLISSLRQSVSRTSKEVSTDDFCDCKWQVLDIIGKFYAVSGRQLRRWGSSAASIDNKLYIFGGRGSDSRPRNSLHVLDLEELSVTLFRAINLPEGREGHSMAAYKNLLIIFGGCGGGKDDNDSFDDLWIVDVENKTWNKPGVIGKKPRGREGHAAGIIRNQMIIYGGKGQNMLFHEIYAFNMNTFEWKELEQQGQHPGPRESMSCCVVHETLYVFGGNISSNPDEDEYTNDLYTISVKNNIANCKKIAVSGEIPKKRLSHSMTNLKNLYILLYGGESYGTALSDVWVYHTDSKFWREITPQNNLRGRMVHLCHAYKNSLFVFGGMTENKVALCELAILKFGKAKATNNGGVAKQSAPVEVPRPNLPVQGLSLDQFYCSGCTHDSSSCQLFERFPEIGTPALNFFAKVQMAVGSLEVLVGLYQDPFAALLRISDLLNSKNVSISVTGEIDIRGSVVCKFPPQDVSIDLSILPLHDNDAESELRNKMLREWRSNSPRRLDAVEVYARTEFSPVQIVKMCSGASRNNFISAIFKISNTGLVISRSEKFTCAILVVKGQHCIPLYLVIFDSNREVVYPHKEIVHANIHNIISRCHLNNVGEILDRPCGTSVFLYPEEVECINNDLLFQGNSLCCLLSKTKNIKYSYFGAQISFDDCNKIRSAETSAYLCNKIESSAFSVLVYFSKRLIFWEYKKSENGKRDREECIEVKVKDSDLICSATGMLDWNIKTMHMFSDVFSGAKKLTKK